MSSLCKVGRQTLVVMPQAVILAGGLGTLTFVQEDQPLGTGGALWNAVDFLEQEFILLWGDDFHPINYQKLVSRHREDGNLMTMTVTESHESMNLRHMDGKVMHYDKHQYSSDFNGYEAGTSVVSKRIVLLFGRDGKWSWEETVYAKNYRQDRCTFRQHKILGYGDT